MKKTYRGSCRCGAVRFETTIDLSKRTSKCNCSICAKTRYWKTIVSDEAFRLLQEAGALTDYQTDGNSIHHRFCSRCGVKPFGRGYADELNADIGGDFYAVNVMCLDDVTPKELAEAPVSYEDGRHDDRESSPDETQHL